MIYILLYNNAAEFAEKESGGTPGDGVVSIIPGVSYTETEEVVDYNPLPAKTITITYVNRIDGTTVTESKSEHTYDTIDFTVRQAPDTTQQIYDEYNFIGWSSVEYPTYAQSQDSNFMKQPGQTISISEDITLYADYSTTFQGLINEGYVRFSQADPTGANAILVLPNNYAKELVVDFMNVFNSDPDKLILRSGSTYGYVGSGSVSNTFVFSSLTQQHWLTTDEWYDIYNGTSLRQYPTSRQFYGMDWSDKDSITINMAGTGSSSTWCAASRAFGPKMPRVLNVNLTDGNGWAYMAQTYGEPGFGCGSEIINLSAVDGRKATAIRRGTWDGQGFNAIFEGARNLKEVHGLETSGVTVWLFAFDGCRALETIPAVDFNSAITFQYSMTQTFCNCWMLRTIEPILFVSAATDTTATFHQCSALTTVYLHGINAASNVCGGGGSFPQSTAYTWDLSYTKMSQACADYAITNLTPCDPTAEGFVMKGINFPSTVTLSDAQITTLRQNGWIPYINGEEVFASA